MNRAQRRAAQKQQPKWQRMSHDQKVASLLKNGITPKDLDKAYEDGRTAGTNGTYQICFAAVCMALSDLHGFGGKRCHRVLHVMQRYIVDSFTSADAVQAVYKRMGLKLDFGDPMNWIEFEDE